MVLAAVGIGAVADCAMIYILWRKRGEVARYCRDTFRGILARFGKSDD